LFVDLIDVDTDDVRAFGSTLGVVGPNRAHDVFGSHPVVIGDVLQERLPAMSADADRRRVVAAAGWATIFHQSPSVSFTSSV
jgi:hypothetical protein